MEYKDNNEKAKKMNLKLSNPIECRRSLARIARDLINGDTKPEVARAFGYLCNCILKSYELHEMELRIENLEKIARDQ